MPRTRSFFLYLGLLTSLSLLVATESRGGSLPKLRLDSKTVTVSGLSSGAFFAIQLQVSHSATIKGSASFNGGVYNCANNSASRAFDTCMSHPEDLQVENSIQKAILEEHVQRVDPLDNLKHSRIYIFSGTRDHTISPISSLKISHFFENFVQRSNIFYNSKIPAAHGQPTLDQGLKCDDERSPWILNCAFDGAKEALSHLLGPLKTRGTARAENFLHFDQRSFAFPNANMDADAFLYIPQSCKGSQTLCRLHVSFHGCKQGPEFGSDYRHFAGYNEWAESNKIVVLYPSIKSSWSNPNGCWDWWGYTGSNYANKWAPQIRSVKAMIDALVNESL